MMHFTVSRVITVARESVYSFILDGSNFVKYFPERILSWKVLSQEGNVRMVEIEERTRQLIGLVRIKHVDKEVLTPPERLESEVIRGVGKGYRTTIVLEDLADATKMEITYKLKENWVPFFLGVCVATGFVLPVNYLLPIIFERFAVYAVIFAITTVVSRKLIQNWIKREFSNYMDQMVTGIKDAVEKKLA